MIPYVFSDNTELTKLHVNTLIIHAWFHCITGHHPYCLCLVPLYYRSPPVLSMPGSTVLQVTTPIVYAWFNCISGHYLHCLCLVLLSEALHSVSSGNADFIKYRSVACLHPEDPSTVSTRVHAPCKA